MKASLKILLVEDDPTIGPLTAEVLATCGYSVQLASDWQDAFDLLAADNTFSVILLDLDLGGIRGETLVERLRARGASLPAVIILSAQPPHELRLAVQRTHAVGALAKPCTARVMCAMVDRVAA